MAILNESASPATADEKGRRHKLIMKRGIEIPNVLMMPASTPKDDQRDTEKTRNIDSSIGLVTREA